MIPSDKLQEILNSNSDLKNHFIDLCERIEKRYPKLNNEACYLAKLLMIDLFRFYGVNVDVNFKEDVDGNKKMKIILKNVEAKNSTMEELPHSSFLKKRKLIVLIVIILFGLFFMLLI